MLLKNNKVILSIQKLDKLFLIFKGKIRIEQRKIFFVILVICINFVFVFYS